MYNNNDIKLYDRSWRNLLSIFFFFLSIFILVFSFINVNNNNGYILFVEFNDAYGLKEGTTVNFRGLKIGYISRIKIHVNKVIVVIKIKCLNTMIPQRCIIEANQIGLFNDRIISITPLKDIPLQTSKKYSQLLKSCNDSLFIRPNSYLRGYKGINYDDLVRATTRISQRFDDPRFFNLFYVLLKNSIEISDELLFLIYNSSNLFFSFLMLLM
uniref:Mce/MlaD domain-containing protein n=1 Tax=Herposiphonia versicolor TaxID=2007163 RepID=A0A1Z1MF72_9FLOR|nr:hypothetical protein [Herposiphonia versicolor]ARW64727.1 hypothetical protein [Herposiphonia versicolor]